MYIIPYDIQPFQNQIYLFSNLTFAIPGFALVNHLLMLPTLKD